MTLDRSVIILVADGVRPDTLSAAIHDGTLPALARLQGEGSYHIVSTAFPSVTGPAYSPFLMGRFPGQVGLPGLRWYDRTRTACRLPSHTRSYVGHEMIWLDSDLDPTIPTLFELVPASLGAIAVIRRGLPVSRRVEGGVPFLLRTAMTHFRGDLEGWLAIDRDIGNALVARVRNERPAFTFAAFTGVDKASHASGHNSPGVYEALTIVDHVVAQLRADAEQGGRWEETHLWIVSDHGHSPVTQHDDLADVVRETGARVMSHPRVFTRNADVAMMVSGNAMAHVYLSLDARTRPFWPALRDRRIGKTTTDGAALANIFRTRPSVDIMLIPTSPTSCDIVTHDRGMAQMTWNDVEFTYLPIDGDPLGVGSLHAVSANESYDLTRHTDYPDALVQIAAICSAPRSGDIILSAARQWDFRARYEPIPHVSAHGALHREHMLVPLLTNHPTLHEPRRTTDVMPSAAALLGCHVRNVDGESFM